VYLIAVSDERFPATAEVIAPDPDFVRSRVPP